MDILTLRISILLCFEANFIQSSLAAGGPRRWPTAKDIGGAPGAVGPDYVCVPDLTTPPIVL